LVGRGYWFMRPAPCAAYPIPLLGGVPRSGGVVSHPAPCAAYPRLNQKAPFRGRGCLRRGGGCTRAVRVASNSPLGRGAAVGGGVVSHPAPCAAYPRPNPPKPPSLEGGAASAAGGASGLSRYNYPAQSGRGKHRPLQDCASQIPLFKPSTPIQPSRLQISAMFL
jgi:hypothetical protein